MQVKTHSVLWNQSSCYMTVIMGKLRYHGWHRFPKSHKTLFDLDTNYVLLLWFIGSLCSVGITGDFHAVFLVKRDLLNGVELVVLLLVAEIFIQKPMFSYPAWLEVCCVKFNWRWYFFLLSWLKHKKITAGLHATLPAMKVFRFLEEAKVHSKSWTLVWMKLTMWQPWDKCI